MKIEINAVSISSSNIDKLIERYPCLKDFGFVLEEKDEEVNVPILDENRDRIYMKTYNSKTRAYVEVNTLEDLLNLSSAVDEYLIVGRTADNPITIYDGYIE